MLAHIFGAEGREEDGRHHADDGEDGGKPHVADDDAAEQRTDDGLAAHLLGDLVGGIGGNVALQGPVVAQHFPHVLQFQGFFFGGGALKVFRLVKGADANADEDGSHCAHAQADPAGGRQEALVVLAAEFGQQHHIQRHGHGHRHQIVEGGGPDADGGTLFGVVGHDGGDGLRRHVGDGVADDVHHIQDREGDPAKAFAGHEIEHAGKAHRLNEETGDQQHPQLAEPGIDPVIDEGQHRVGDTVQNPGAGQDDAHRRGGDAIPDAGGVTGHVDERVDAHAHQGVAGVQNDLPHFGTAVLNTVDLTLTGFLFSKHCDSSL